MADYLEAYAARFELPVRTGVRVDRLSRNGGPVRGRRGRPALRGRQRGGGDGELPGPPGACLRRTSSIPASSSCIPASTGTPRSSRTGGVLVVGAGNSGAEIALEVVRRAPDLAGGQGDRPRPVPHRGRRGTVRLPAAVVPGRRPPRADGATRRSAARCARRSSPTARRSSGSSPRTSPPPASSASLGSSGVRDGLPLLEDERVLDVANVIWCTGFRSRLLLDRPPRLRRRG